jgi:hypothetical protein
MSLQLYRKRTGLLDYTSFEGLRSPDTEDYFVCPSQVFRI